MAVAVRELFAALAADAEAMGGIEISPCSPHLSGLTYASTHRGAAMSTTAENIQRQISENPVLIYMKGSPQLPQCGFSAQTVQALMACGERFAFVNILDNPDIRSELPKIANWPTFPQLWVEGELVGGCDIVVEMHGNGELETLVKQAAERARAKEEGEGGAEA